MDYHHFVESLKRFIIKNFSNKLDFKIPESLREYVVCAIHGQSDSEIQITYPVHPNGFPLLINIYGDMPTLHIGGKMIHPKSRLILAGQVRAKNLEIEMDGVFGQIGFVLRPTTPYYLFQKCGSYFLNRWRSVENIVPNDSDRLEKTLDSTGEVMARLDIMLEFLNKLSLKAHPRHKWLDRTLKIILHTDGRVSQNKLAEIVGFSLRHFRRRFKEVIGVSPKYYCKVIQMNTFFEIFKSSDETKLNTMALDCGYYDQAHFNRDFNSLIGDSPRKFLNGDHSFAKDYLGRL
ncbi:AraC family transcriptional regulator [Pricia sp. S334]|uniref:AraC family transcriptional regulator n=1 Tax=Pricia mediterranea TaxID=3076079 RepID=A0ABU3L1Q8_9FLAO|nr:AraC family transcriptional regulator [Pricia sp. S334]MDT7827139.1 AraC family transcriptional regulator [Pricia sp. S334]